MPHTTLMYWLALARIGYYRPRPFHRLIQQLQTPQAIFAATELEWTAAGLHADEIKNLQQPPWVMVEQDIRFCEETGCHIIPWDNENYPNLLREIADPPLLLFVRGNVQLLNKPQIAIVGARHPTVSGLEIATLFAKSLALAGVLVTSGLAMGIDGAAHLGALQGNSTTLAVLGTGIDIIYPKKHTALFERILRDGAILSEFPPRTPPHPQHFPQRNRIISGLCLGVLVIEAMVQSGSLITARLALEQNREVFAVPGAIHNPLTRGCHQLIQQGAKLVVTVTDILEEFGDVFQSETLKNKEFFIESSQPILSKLEQKIWELIDYETTSLDVIIARSGLTASLVSSMLLALELKSYVLREVGGYRRTGTVSP